MKDKILKALKSKLLFAVALNLLIAVLCVWVTSFSYSDSSDFYNSILICRDHFYYSSTINYILAVIAGTIQYAVTDINAFVLVELGLSFAAFTSITFVLADQYNYRKAFVFSMVINILFALNHYSEIDSTKTSALLLAGGFLLVLNAIRNKRYSLSCWAGVAEILFGTFYCYVYFFVALAFAVAFFFGDMMAKKKYRLDFQKFFWYFRPFLLMFIFITLLALGANQFSYSINHATEESAKYYEYEQLSDKIDTLPFPDFTENQEEFASVGIDDSAEYELLKMNYYDADKMLDTDSLKTVYELQQKESEKTILYVLGDVFGDIWNHLVWLDAFAIAGIVYLLISAVFIVYHKNRFSFFPLFYFIVGYLSGFLIRLFYNNTENLTYGIWVFMIAMLLNSFNFELERKERTNKLRQNNGYLIISASIVIGLAQDGIHTVLQCAQNSLGQRVGERHIIVVREIALHGVHHHVGHASSRLVRRQSEGAFGIHNGKLRPRDIVRITQLHAAILVRDNTSLAHLASGSRDGKHQGNGQTADSLSLTHIEVPHITLVDRAVGNGLG